MDNRSPVSEPVTKDQSKEHMPHTQSIGDGEFPIVLSRKEKQT
jgi:hypothetical protein